MALLLNEIEWGEPVLDTVPDPAWEAEVKRRAGHVSEVDRRIARSDWLRRTALESTCYEPRAMSERLFRIGSMVTAQENACRYCYGATRAYMKILGYSEQFIQQVERDVLVAEMDERDRGFIVFCRNLARSRPRPSRAAREQLRGVGFSDLQITEMAFAIASCCFYNRVSTLLACPPEAGFERLANGPLGRLAAWAAPLVRALGALKRRAPPDTPLDAEALAAGRFGPVLVPLAGLPAAGVMKSALDGAFASEVLGRIPKVLMFAVVARTLVCSHCEAEAKKLLVAEGMSAEEVESALATLQSDRLPPHQGALLNWTRETVYYESAKIQQTTRELAAELGDQVLVEAIGVAALANATVRLAMLLE